MELHMIRTWHPMNNSSGGYWSYAIYDSAEAAARDFSRVSEEYKKAEQLEGTLTVIRSTAP